MTSMIVGREPELAALRLFLDGATSARSLILHGPPGMGKTTLWEACVAIADEGGLRVLRARPTDAETAYAYGSLADLLEPITSAELSALPPPQSRALEVALLRIEPTGAPPDQRAVATALTTMLRALATEAPLIVAIDDLQWLDPASAEALTFATRRLHGHRVRFVLARRTEATTAIEAAGEPLERLEIGPISIGAMRRMLLDRLDLTLPRRVLTRVGDISLGNPMFALEIGRMLVGKDASTIGTEIPLPDRLEDLVGPRVADLPACE